MARVSLVVVALAAVSPSVSACFSPEVTPFGNASLGPAASTSGTVGEDSTTDAGPTTDATATVSSTGPGNPSTSESGIDSSSDGSSPVGCGDGVIAGAEACDDGDTAAGDGCSEVCEVELGFSCQGQPSTCASSCGDGIAAADEACDDDNTADGDGCTACTVDPGFRCMGVMPSVCTAPCGNGVVDGPEICDDGDALAGDGCAADCTVELYYRCNGAGPGSCVPIRIGYIPADTDDAAFRDAIAAITGGPVDYVDARSSTPTLLELEASYDCVFTHPDFSYADSMGFGDALAGYVDGGGNVVLGIATDYAPPTGLSTSLIMQAAYAPVTTSGGVAFMSVTYAGDGTTPIHTGIGSYGVGIYDIGVALQGTGIQESTYDDGTIASAYRPDWKVVYLNGTGNASLMPMGEWPRLVANACSVGFLQ